MVKINNSNCHYTEAYPLKERFLFRVAKEFIKALIELGYKADLKDIKDINDLRRT